MKDIPLVRVRYVDSFAQQLNTLGAPTERLLNTVNLAEEMLGYRDGFIPVRQLWRLTALAARYTGIWEMGLRAGMTPLVEHSQFGQNLLFAPTLYQAMSLFCSMAPAELTNAQFSIKRDRQVIWFCGGPVEGSDEEVRQVELYRLGMIVQVIRWAAGCDWKPAELQLQSQTLAHLRESNLIENTRVRTGSRELAVAISPVLISQPLKSLGNGSQPAPPSVAGPDLDVKSALKEVIRTHVRGGRGTVRGVARSLDMSERTLYRRLSSHGLSFSQLVDQVRVETATALLSESNLPIGDIAREAGYSEPTHFSRAFKRITGNSPHQYRIHLQASQQQ